MANKPNQKSKKRPIRLQDALVLYHYMLSLLGCAEWDAVADTLNHPELEGREEDGYSKYCHALINALHTGKITISDYKRYDSNITRWTDEINKQRSREPIQWKYYQYVGLLLTEIFLDNYFNHQQLLLDDLNKYTANTFINRSNAYIPECLRSKIPSAYWTTDDLNKLAFWCATGSGKTLMMHVNIKQYIYYAKNAGSKIDHIFVITPNEGLTTQHIEEFSASGMSASRFNKNGGSMFAGQQIEIMDINKLSDKSGPQTVASSSLVGRNLVIVDEGHKGTGGNVWMKHRNTLTQGGFCMEYSATFGQAISALSGKNRVEMIDVYAKATLFDYSYRYFYSDGYGKDYRIMNMSGIKDSSALEVYLTAYLMTLCEQQIIYKRSNEYHKKYLIDHPLGIFVGSSVNAVREEKDITGKKINVSDVIAIVKFLGDFIDNRTRFENHIKRLLDTTQGINDATGKNIFGGSFRALKHGNGTQSLFVQSQGIYDLILQNVYNSANKGQELHIDQLGSEGEIGIRLGDNDYFSVINVGDADNLLKLFSANGYHTNKRTMVSQSLFHDIKDANSKVNILIGSKKFTEGWSCWRVSLMGLMNVGKSEGSEIIQMFGRGVRLRGYQVSLKRSKALYTQGLVNKRPDYIDKLETLSIFGVNSDYMKEFQAYLQDEGLPPNESDRIDFVIPTTAQWTHTLKTIEVDQKYDFKKNHTVTTQQLLNLLTTKRIKVKIDWRPKADALISGNQNSSTSTTVCLGVLSSKHLNLLDWNRIFFAMQQAKNTLHWSNMEISIDLLIQLMKDPSWYELQIAPDDLKLTDYRKDITRWENICIDLLRGYLEVAYKYCKGEEEGKHLCIKYLSTSSENYYNEYEISVTDDGTQMIQDIIVNLDLLKGKIDSNSLNSDFAIDQPFFMAGVFSQHMYKPLLYKTAKTQSGAYCVDVNGDKLVTISPVELNDGEWNFVRDLRDYYNKNISTVFANKDLFLLRNLSRKGIGFFEANNFYPDFIMWIVDKNTNIQHIVFIDPKGIRNLKGLSDPKIQLYKTLKNIETQLADPTITLNSFIVSNTKYADVKWWLSPPSIMTSHWFLSDHIVFQEEMDYIDQIIRNI